MSNDYFNHNSSTLTDYVKARVGTLNTIFSAITEGFGGLPTLAMFRNGTTNYGTASGVANAYVVTRTFAATALTDGMEVRFKVGAGITNTGASTLNVDSLGGLDIKMVDGTDPAAGDLTAGDFITVVYDADNFRFVITSIVRSTLS